MFIRIITIENIDEANKFTMRKIGISIILRNKKNNILVVIDPFIKLILLRKILIIIDDISKKLNIYIHIFFVL